MSMVFGMVHSDRTVVVLLQKHFSSWLSTFCNSISIITNYMYAAVGQSNIMAYFLTFCWPCIMQWFLVIVQIDAQILFNVFIYL